MLASFPPVIGHRGAAAHAPENTLESIRHAAHLGVEMVEIDVQLSSDEVPVIIHDWSLDRTTTAGGLVYATPWATIRELDAGAPFGEAFAGEHVPTLQEVLALCSELHLRLNIEIKPYPGTEVRTAQIALAAVRDLWSDPSSLLISSFSVTSLMVAKEMAPDIARGYLIDERPDVWSANADAVGAATINFDHEKTTDKMIAEYRATGRPVLSYTVNSAHRAQELFRLGVNAVFTDFPGRILEVSPW